MLKKIWEKYSLIIVISLIVAVISILYLIIGYAKTGEGAVYLWTGHYYLDYFYYLQFVAQGLRGYWLPRQYSATDDPSLYFHLEPYLLIGQAGRLFGLSPIAAYWISVFILVFLIVMFIFLTIERLLQNKPFYIQFGALLMSLTAGPFFLVVKAESGLRINLFEYWASYGNFFKRFEAVPHHLLAHVLILLIFLICARYLRQFKTIRMSLLWALLIGIILAAVLSFYPFQVVTVSLAIGITCFLYFLQYLRQKNYQAVINLVVFVIVLGSLVLVAGLLINHLYYQTMFFQSTKGVEVGWKQFVFPKDALLNLGPLLLLALFGIRKLVRNLNSLGLLLVIFVLSSFVLFYSSLDQVLNTHNGRFLSPLSYVLLGALAVLGIEQITGLLRIKNKKGFFIFIIIIFTILSLPPQILSFQEKLDDKNLSSPISYLPKGIIEGFKFLDQQPEKGNVLMAPSQFLGTVMPAFADRKTYVARHAATPNYIDKNIRTSNFYLGAMSNGEALIFLRKNNLRFVVLTSIEGYSVQQLYKYPFLKEMFKNKDIIIFKVEYEADKVSQSLFFRQRANLY